MMTTMTLGVCQGDDLDDELGVAGNDDDDEEEEEEGMLCLHQYAYFIHMSHDCMLLLSPLPMQSLRRRLTSHLQRQQQRAM